MHANIISTPFIILFVLYYAIDIVYCSSTNFSFEKGIVGSKKILGGTIIYFIVD